MPDHVPLTLSEAEANAKRKASKTVELATDALACLYEERMCILRDDGSRILEKTSLFHRKQFCPEWCETEDGLRHTACIEISEYVNLVFEDDDPWKDVGRALKAIENELPKLFVLRGSKLRKGTFGPLGWEWLLWLRRSSLTLYDVKVSAKMAKALGLDQDDDSDDGKTDSPPKSHVVPALTYTNKSVGFETDAKLGRKFVVKELKAHEKLFNRIFDKEVERMWYELDPYTPANIDRGGTAATNLKWLQKLARQQRELKLSLFRELIDSEEADTKKLFQDWSKRKQQLSITLPRAVLQDDNLPAALQHAPSMATFNRNSLSKLQRRLTDKRVATNAVVALAGAVMNPEMTNVKIHAANEHDLQAVKQLKQQLTVAAAGPGEDVVADRAARVERWMQLAEERKVAKDLVLCLNHERVLFEKSWLQIGRILWLATRGTSDALDTWVRWARRATEKVTNNGLVPLCMGSYHAGSNRVCFHKDLRKILVDGSTILCGDRNYVVARDTLDVAADLLAQMSEGACHIELLTSRIMGQSASEVVIFKNVRQLVKHASKFWNSFTPTLRASFAVNRDLNSSPSFQGIDNGALPDDMALLSDEQRRGLASDLMFRFVAERIRASCVHTVDASLAPASGFQDITPAQHSLKYQSFLEDRFRRLLSFPFHHESHFYIADSRHCDEEQLKPAREGVQPLCGVKPSTAFFSASHNNSPRVFYRPPSSGSDSKTVEADCIVVEGRTFVFRHNPTTRGGRRTYQWWLVEKLDHLRATATLRYLCTYGTDEFFDNFNRVGIHMPEVVPSSPADFPFGSDHSVLAEEGLRVPDWGETVVFLRENPGGASSIARSEPSEAESSDVSSKEKTRLRIPYREFWYGNILLWNHVEGGGPNIRYPPEGVLFQLVPEDSFVAIETLQNFVAKDRLRRAATRAAAKASTRARARRAFHTQCEKRRRCLFDAATEEVDALPGEALAVVEEGTANGSEGDHHNNGVNATNHNTWNVIGRLCKSLAKDDSDASSLLFDAWTRWGLRSSKWRFFKDRLGFSEVEFLGLCRDEWATFPPSFDHPSPTGSDPQPKQMRSRDKVHPALLELSRMQTVVQRLENICRELRHGDVPQASLHQDRDFKPKFKVTTKECKSDRVCVDIFIPKVEYNTPKTGDQTAEIALDDSNAIDAIEFDWCSIFEVETAPNRRSATFVSAKTAVHISCVLRSTSHRGYEVEMQVSKLRPSSTYSVRINQSMLLRSKLEARRRKGNDLAESKKYLYFSLVTMPRQQKITIVREKRGGAVGTESHVRVKWQDVSGASDDAAMLRNASRGRNRVNIRQDTLTYQLFMRAVPPILRLWNSQEKPPASLVHMNSWEMVYEGKTRHVTKQLVPGYTYQFRVFAVSSTSVNSPASSAVCTTCRLAPLQPPVPLRIGPSSIIVWMPLRQARDRNIWDIQDFYALRLQAFMAQLSRKRRGHVKTTEYKVPQTLIQEITIELTPTELNDQCKTGATVPTYRGRGKIVQVVRRVVVYHSNPDGTVQIDGATKSQRSHKYFRQQMFCVRLTGLDPNKQYSVRTRMRLSSGNEKRVFDLLDQERIQLAALPVAGSLHHYRCVCLTLSP